jgi:hypothetical protein
MQAVAVVLSRQNPADTPENGEFVLHVDSSAWRELGAALEEEQNAESDSTVEGSEPSTPEPISPPDLPPPEGTPPADGTVLAEDPFAS